MTASTLAKAIRCLRSAPITVVPSWAFPRCAAVVLAASLGSSRASALLVRTREMQSVLRKTRPAHTPGVNLLLRYLEWDNALWRALSEAGIDARQAGELIERINWSLFEPLMTIAFWISRLRSVRLDRRVQWIFDGLFRWLFSSPFVRVRQPLPGGVAFDVTVCPLAQYFRDQNLPQLTRHAACSLDHQMARIWGVSLQRTQTLAEGHRLCDFRFRTIAAATRVSAAQR